MSVTVGDVARERGDALRIAQIERNEGRIDAAIRQGGSGFPSPLLDKFGDDDRSRTFRRSGFGKGPPKPAPGAGDRHDPAV